jgi:hypothetical protein
VSARGVWGLVLFATAAFSCTKLNPGHCEQKSDCEHDGSTCSPTMKICVPTDGGTSGGGGAGGAAGAGGVKGGTGGKPFSCADIACMGGTPICDMDAGGCKGCESEAPSACKTLNAMTPVCVTTTDAGASAMLGTCVGCLTNSDCSDNTKPVCLTTTTYAGSSPMNHKCGCLKNADCAGTIPVCELTETGTVPAYTCRSCASDGECGGPGICMADGHCASDTEVIFVDESTSSCPTATGSSASPYCTLPAAVNVLGSARPVIVILGPTNDRLALATTNIKPVIIGRNNSGSVAAKIPALTGIAVSISSDTVLVRDLMVNFGSAPGSVGIAVNGTATVSLLRVTVALQTAGLGIDAEGGTMLSMNGCLVENNPAGGILLNEAAFDIENTTVTGNGPGSFGASTLGGILVNNGTAVNGPTQISSTTISNNSGPGLTCVAAITGDSVLAFNNSPVNIQNCAVFTCADASATCGAQ